ncbi:hypothetical protein HH214_18870 [Mucilaginibacter robiniae]|uniref:Uncharacterized protein n=1 Tax=Mucilaginibacter robiniae TaxID=2728022 RepID=A0A7L5E328_9SPHI|nr:hypothetical protein [Mucilaginibacter robiniae]QJD97790.1 hypothetical protein HH214_18870 [Mucilaginibacter robiniae]
MKFTPFLALLLVFKLFATAQTVPVRVGQHAFTIQYITFDNKNKPGTVLIRSLGRDEYSIEGEQRDKLKNDYVTIKGTFLARGRELKFNGKIVSKISYVNNGQPCESTGLVIFKASGKRKYWRLQQMLNCDGISTDYIDIFF